MVYYDIGTIYREGGYGLEKNISTAIKWWTQGDEHNDEWSQLFLGFYYDGLEYYFERNIDTSTHYFFKSASNGNLMAHKRLAQNYIQIKEYDKAFLWLKKAVEKEYTDAYGLYAQCFMNGWGTDIDLEKALYWAEKYAESGNDDAQEILKLVKSKGSFDCNRDFFLTPYWAEKYAESGKGDAQEILKLVKSKESLDYNRKFVLTPLCPNCGTELKEKNGLCPNCGVITFLVD